MHAYQTYRYIDLIMKNGDSPQPGGPYTAMDNENVFRISSVNKAGGEEGGGNSWKP